MTCGCILEALGGILRPCTQAGNAFQKAVAGLVIGSSAFCYTGGAF